MRVVRCGPVLPRGGNELHYLSGGFILQWWNVVVPNGLVSTRHGEKCLYALSGRILVLVHGQDSVCTGYLPGVSCERGMFAVHSGEFLWHIRADCALSVLIQLPRYLCSCWTVGVHTLSLWICVFHREGVGTVPCGYRVVGDSGVC